MESRLLGQFLLTGVPGPELDADTARRFKALQPGGFILFGRNIQSPEQLRKLIDDLRDEIGRPGKLDSLWMLLPMAATGLPTVDDVPVPVITSTQWANVPVAWAKNLHRAASTA